jgi:Spy/CpxP family protein refolding chaperone
MLRRSFLPTLAALLVLAACAESPIGTSSAFEEDFALAMFGAEGAALEGTLGPQAGPRPFDGRSHRPHFPDSLALTNEQKAEMHTLREAFRTEHASALDSLRAIFQEARTARDSGATREEVRAILVTGRPIAEALRPDVRALHVALRAVLTDAQRAWIAAHRPPRHHGPMP